MNLQSLKFRYGMAFLSLGGLLIIIVAVTYIMGKANEDTGQIINVSGGQRMRTVKLAYLLERYQVNYGPNELKVIGDAVSDYDARMKALESGGAFGIEKGVSSEALKNELKKSVKIWEDFKILIMDGLAEKYDPNKIDAAIKDLLLSLDKLTNGLADESVRKNKLAMILEIGLTFIALCMIFAYTFTNNHYTVNPIAEIVKTVRTFAEGDITQRSKYATGMFEFKDEIYELEESLNAAIENTEKVITDIVNTSSKLASSSEQLSASSVQIAKGAEAQTQKAAQVATAAEQMSATVIEVAKNASGASEAAKDANKAAHKGGDIVKRTVQGMDGIAKSVKESAAVIGELGSRSSEIGKIIKVIDDIADQTNLLALNAAIEAARAGEQGRGFAVVADEVRKLAERTGKATKEIGEMIKAIQEETKKAVASMDAGTKEVEIEVKLAKEAGEALGEIIESVDRVTGMIQQIATASEEQSTASDQISGDIETVASVTKETSTGANQIASASNDLAGLASELQTMVSRFKIGDESSKSKVQSSKVQETRRQVGGGMKSLPNA